MSGIWDKLDKWWNFKTEPNKFESDVDIESDSETEFHHEPFDLSAIIFYIPVAGFISSIGLILWQIFIYLRLGEWQPYTVITAMRYFNIEWASNPQSWFGIYKILNNFSLSAALFLTGIASIILWMLIDRFNDPKI